MTEQEAIEIGKKFAEDKGYDRIEPLRAVYAGGWFGKGGCWEIWESESIRESQIVLIIDDTTGVVLQYFGDDE